MSPRHRHRTASPRSLAGQFPPSEPCSCAICVGFCSRPGWWSVEQAARAIDAGHAFRMMLEFSPDRTFGVLSPAFKGCEANLALEAFARTGCTYLKGGACELHGTGHQPLECRHCHHDDPSAGPRCHSALEKDWQTPEGQGLVIRWGRLTGLWERIDKFQVQNRAR